MEGGTVVVSFGTTWCGPCAILAPELETAATALEDYDDITIAKVSSFSCARPLSRRPAVPPSRHLSRPMPFGVFSFPTICHTVPWSPPSSLFSRLYCTKRLRKTHPPGRWKDRFDRRRFNTNAPRGRRTERLTHSPSCRTTSPSLPLSHHHCLPLSRHLTGR